MRTCSNCGTRQPPAPWCAACGSYLAWSPAEPEPPAPPAEAKREVRAGDRPVGAVTSAAAKVTAGRRLAVEQDRADLAQRLDSTHARLTRRATTVVVVGEFKRGKSTLVNALLRRVVCPVDADIVTAVPTLVRHGEVPGATAFYEPPPTTAPPPEDLDREVPAPAARAVALPLQDVRRVVSELGWPAGTPRPSSVEIRLPARLLKSGLCLVDTPGVGGLDSAHGIVTLSALDLADGALFVTDASQELTAPEVQFLKLVVARCPVTACVVAKTDLHREWRRIVEIDRRHLARAGLEIPVIGVSSFLRMRVDQTPELDEESGFRALVEFLVRQVMAASGERAVQAAAVDVGFVAAQLGRQVAAERRVVAAPEHAAAVVARLATTQERTGQLTSPDAGWRQVLSDRVQDLIAAVEHQLRDRLREVTREVEDVIDRGDPKDAWPDVEAWLRREVASAAVATYDEMGRLAERVVEDVATQFDLEAGIPFTPASATPVAVVDEIAVGPLDLLPTGGPLSSALLAVRGGAFVPMVLFAAASQLPAGLAALAGAAVLGPVGLALFALISRKMLRDERARQLMNRRQQAKARARQYIDEVVFQLGKDCRDALRVLQRQLRDEFHERAATLHRSSVATLTAARRAQDLDTNERTRRRESLEQRASRLRTLEREVAELAAAAPAVQRA